MKKILLALLSCICVLGGTLGLVACDVAPDSGHGGGGKEEHTKHDYVEYVFPPTCTEKGYTKYVCECGDSYLDNYVDPKHDWEDKLTVDREATCTKDGFQSRHCKKCNEVTDEAVIPADASKHVFLEIYDVDVYPNCTE